MSGLDARLAAIPEHLRLDQLERFCRREVDFRRQQRGRMLNETRGKLAEADIRIAQTEALVTLLSALQQPGAALVIDATRPDEAARGAACSTYLLADMIPALLADPDGFGRAARPGKTIEGAAMQPRADGERDDREHSPEGRSGTAREASSAGSGRDVLQASRGVQPAAPTSSGRAPLQGSLLTHAAARQTREAMEGAR